MTPWLRLAAIAIVTGLLAMPLARTLAYPLRISVFQSLQVDAQAYDAIALDLATRRTIDAIPSLQPPGFVVFLAAIFAVAGHSWVAAKVALWILLVALAAGAGLLAHRVFRKESAGWIAALMCTGSPALQAFTGTLQYEILAAALLILLLLLADHAARCSIRGRAVLAALGLGAAAGLAVLTREVLVAVVPVLALFVATRWRRRWGMQTATFGALIVLTTAFVLVTLWAWTQSNRAGRIVALTDKGPLVMAFGNNPRANGTFNVPLVGVGEPAGWAFIRAEPAQAIRLAGRKALYFWGVLRDGWNVPRPAATWLARATLGHAPLESLLPFARGGWILLGLMLALAWWGRSAWSAWWILPACVAAIMAIHLVTLSSHRFAVPVLPVCFVIIAGPLARAAERIARSRLLLVSAAALLAWLLAAQERDWPLSYELSAADLDGFNGQNVVDAVTGDRVRVVDKAGGRRAALLLSDEHLPGGALTLGVAMRALDGGTGDGPVARMALTSIDGESACDRVVLPGELSRMSFEPVEVECLLAVDGPVTLLVETLGSADLAFKDVRMRWARRDTSPGD